MPRKGQKLSRMTQRYSYNTQAHKRNDTHKFLKDGIRKSYSNTKTRRRRGNSNADTALVLAMITLVIAILRVIIQAIYKMITSVLKIAHDRLIR